MIKWLTLFCLLWLTPALAADDIPPRPWDQLSAEEQKVLQPLRERWDALPPERQQKLLQGAKRWQQMSPDERREARERHQRWQKMKPEQRQKAHEWLQWRRGFWHRW